VYKYTFTKPPTTPAAKIDRNKSFLAGVYSHRTVNGVDSPASDTFAFVPATGAAGQRTQIIDEASCNRCHNNPRLEAHDSRVGVSLCLACHAGDQAGAAPAYQDPESGADIDFRSMIHKIHLGSSTPTNAGPFFIVGFTTQQTGAIPETSVHDWSDVDFPPDVRSCQACHQGSTSVAPQLERWKTNASAKPCTACHVNVKFDASAPATCRLGVHDFDAPCNHIPGPTLQSDCASCHVAGSAGLGPDKVHVPGWAVANARFKYDIANATVGADRKVTVQFRVVDPSQANKPWNIKTDAPFTATGGNSSLNVRFAWPTTEYTNEGSNQSYGQPDTVNALTAATDVAGQPGLYQAVSNVPVPAGVNDVTVAIEGHPWLADQSGVATSGERMPVTSVVQTIGAARRQVVSADKCNACHGLLSAHGSNRNGTPAVCVVCHNPEATDKSRRVAGVTGEAAIDFKVLVHAIHAGDIRQTPYDVYGFGNTLNVFPAPYPGGVGNCAMCHVNTSYQLPLQGVVHDTTISTGADPKAISDNVRMKAATAVCTSCHDYVKFDGSGSGDCKQGVKETTACNHVAGIVATSDCAACHTAGGVGVGTVHPIAQP
jgi:OmcA/MtrC family decaheme c-type cytochrome